MRAAMSGTSRTLYVALAAYLIFPFNSVASTTRMARAAARTSWGFTEMQSDRG
jgi:hypothetical protein